MRFLDSLRVIAAWGFTLVYALFASTVAIFTLGHWSHGLTPALLRFWGRTMLKIVGVTVKLEGYEHLTAPHGKIATFNHSSLLDAMFVTAIMPKGSVAAIKREVLFYPAVGLGIWALGFLIIDRGNSDRARRTLAKAAARLQGEKLTVFIAPEGTRNQDGQLLPFKRGAFHLAVTSGAPIVPVVMSGGRERLPYGQFWTRQGVIHIRALPPVEVKGLTVDDIPALSDRVRVIYRAELAAMAASA